MKKLVSIFMAAFFAMTLSLSVQATENPFGMSDLTQGSQVAMSGESKCGGEDKKCGGDKKCGDGDKKDKKCGH